MAAIETAACSFSGDMNIEGTDWTLCLLCQSKTSDPLVDPSKNRNQSVTSVSGYKPLSDNFNEFASLNSLPLGI